MVAHPTLVASGNENVDPGTPCSSQKETDTVPSSTVRPGTPTSPEASTSSMSLVRESLGNRGLSESATSLIMQSWRMGTKQQYKPFISKWEQYCSTRQIDPFYATIEQGINFLAELYQTGMGYSALNTARSALSTMIFVHSKEHSSFGQHPLVCRFIKGTFESRPSLPRYQDTWDVTVVLDYLTKLGAPTALSMKNLTLKVVMLMALLSGQRRQTLHSLRIDLMRLSADKCIFTITSLLKTSRPGKHLSFIEFQAYAPDIRLCVVRHLEHYVNRTSHLRGDETQLLISYSKPHKSVSTDTISRWLKTTLHEAGIDTSKYSAHSTRSASTSAAKMNSVSVDTIMKSAGWTQESTFAKYYHKPVVPQNNFGTELLKAVLN